jgi:hypothetical protein
VRGKVKGKARGYPLGRPIRIRGDSQPIELLALCAFGLALFGFRLCGHLDLSQRGHGIVETQRMPAVSLHLRPAGLRGFLAFALWYGPDIN